MDNVVENPIENDESTERSKIDLNICETTVQWQSNDKKINDHVITTNNVCDPMTINEVTTNNPQLSKRQQKKLLKMQQWDQKKKEKRLKEREKYKQKRLEAIAKGESINIGPTRKQLKKNKIEKSTNFLQVVFDLDFDDLMIDKDIAKCVKQLLRVYTINRRSKMPAKLYFCGIKMNGRIHKCLEKNDGYQNWDVNWHFKPYTDVLELNRLIYLTSDSDNELIELDKNAIYIIGGLVDHNHQKGLCYDRATKLGIKTARLPLNKFVDMKTRTVLCTYHVFEILLRISEGKDWTETLLDVLPIRKGVKLKNKNDTNIETKTEEK